MPMLKMSNRMVAGFAALALNMTTPTNAAAGVIDNEQPGGCSISVDGKDILLTIGARPENSVAFSCLKLNQFDRLRDAFRAALNNSAAAPKGDVTSCHITHDSQEGFQIGSGARGKFSAPISCHDLGAAAELVEPMNAAVSISYGKPASLLPR